jgi:hypothetical protein
LVCDVATHNAAVALRDHAAALVSDAVLVTL